MSNPYAAFFKVVIFCFALGALVAAPSILTMIIAIIGMLILFTI